MADIDTTPRSLSPARAPMPAQKSTLPSSCWTNDPLLALTPEKQAKPIFHNTKSGSRNSKSATHNGKSASHNAKSATHNAKTTTHNTTLGCVRVERHGGSPIESVAETRNVLAAKHKTANKASNLSKGFHQISGTARADKPKSATMQATQKSKMDLKNNKDKKLSKTRNHQKSTRAGVDDEGTSRNPLAQPHRHSSVAVSRHFERLQDEEFDSENAVLDTLQECQSARVAFAEKVAEGVNRPLEERKYSGLISVDAPVEGILAQEKVKSKALRSAPSKKISEGPAPDILDLFTPDMIVEQPSFDLSTLNLQQGVKLEEAPSDMAFNLYKHMRCWESS